MGMPWTTAADNHYEVVIQARSFWFPVWLGVHVIPYPWNTIHHRISRNEWTIGDIVVSAVMNHVNQPSTRIRIMIYNHCFNHVITMCLNHGWFKHVWTTTINQYQPLSSNHQLLPTSINHYKPMTKPIHLPNQPATNPPLTNRQAYVKARMLDEALLKTLENSEADGGPPPDRGWW